MILLLTEIRDRLPKKKSVSDEQWFKDLATDPDYADVFESENRKMDQWLAAHPGRRKTRRFVEAWLAKVERALPQAKPVLPKAMQQVPTRPEGVAPPEDVIAKLGLKNWGNF